MNSKSIKTGFLTLIAFLFVAFSDVAYAGSKNFFVQLLDAYEKYQEVNMALWLTGNVAAERRFGEELRFWQKLQSHEERNQATVKYVRKIFDKLTPQYNFHGMRPTITILRDNTINAFATPGCYIYLYTGMLNFVKSDDELAAVLAHELSHAQQRHSLKNFRASTAMVALLKKAVKNKKDRDSWGAILMYLAEMKFSRVQEDEADDIGQFKMAAAGFNPAAQITLWERMLKDGGDVGGIRRYLSSHPTNRERIENAKRNLAKMNVASAAKFAKGEDKDKNKKNITESQKKIKEPVPVVAPKPAPKKKSDDDYDLDDDDDDEDYGLDDDDDDYDYDNDDDEYSDDDDDDDDYGYKDPGPEYEYDDDDDDYDYDDSDDEYDDEYDDDSDDEYVDRSANNNYSEKPEQPKKQISDEGQFYQLINNGGFEEDLLPMGYIPGWTVESGSFKLSSVAHSGKNSIEVLPSEQYENSTIYTDYIPVSESSSFFFNLYVKGAGPGAEGSVGFELYDGSRQLRDKGRIIPARLFDEDWEHYAGKIENSTNNQLFKPIHKYIRIFLQNSSRSQNSIYFDDMSLRIKNDQ